jgi:CO/xanthine dehydrogenase Mo-binding subunit
MSIPSYAYTCAVCEVEVDPDAGLVEVIRYVSIDDCGRAVNPMLIHGQSHGGIAQGIGQALWEACVYDPRSQMYGGWMRPQVRFALDSPLEGDGFEPSVPRLR